MATVVAGGGSIPFDFFTGYDGEVGMA